MKFDFIDTKVVSIRLDVSKFHKILQIRLLKLSLGWLDTHRKVLGVRKPPVRVAVTLI